MCPFSLAALLLSSWALGSTAPGGQLDMVSIVRLAVAKFLRKPLIPNYVANSR